MEFPSICARFCGGGAGARTYLGGQRETTAAAFTGGGGVPGRRDQSSPEVIGVRRALVVVSVLAVGLAGGSSALPDGRSAAAAGSAPAAAQGAAQTPTRGVRHEVARFKRQLAKSGYVSQQGDATVFQLNDKYCSGFLFSAMWPNPQSPYIITRLPEVPGQAPNTNRVPDLTFGGIPAAVTWHLREDEAVVIVGTTPPPMAYFSVDLMMLKGALNVGPVVWPSIGDPTNVATIRTTGRSPFGRPFAVVVTGNRHTQAKVDRMLAAAGLGGATNNKPIPSSMFRLGLGENADQFLLAMRTAVPKPGFVAARDAYQAAPPLQVFRVRPKGGSADATKPVYARAPFAVPRMRVPGTGKSELDLNPTLQLLRERIIARFPGYAAQDVPLDQRIEESYPGLQIDAATDPPAAGIGAASSDARYLFSAPFALPEGSFAVAYGIDHRATGKVTYSSVSIYADPEAAVALQTEQSPELQGSARDFIADQPNAGKFYAWSFSRAGAGGPTGAHVSALPPIDTAFCAQYGTSRPVDLGTMQVWTRSYMEPATKTRPALSELLLDRLLVFTPTG